MSCNFLCDTILYYSLLFTSIYFIIEKSSAEYYRKIIQINYKIFLILHQYILALTILKEKLLCFLIASVLWEKQTIQSVMISFKLQVKPGDVIDH